MVNNLEKATQVLKDHLKDKGYRSTPERFSVLEEIYTNNGHYNADELFLNMKNKGSRISRATVYNTLEILVECNLVDGHQFGHNHTHYERRLGYKHHDHLVCNYCDNIIEFSMPELEMLQDEMCERLGFAAERHSLEIFGMCQSCRNKRESESSAK